MISIAELLFPNVCFRCGSRCGPFLVCERCFADTDYIDGAICGICGSMMEEGESTVSYFGEGMNGDSNDLNCRNCLLNSRVTYYGYAGSVAYYEGVLKDALMEFKFRRKLELKDFLTNSFAARIPRRFYDKYDVAIPVPLHITKLRKREFNQSAVLAKAVADELGIENDPYLLKRTRATKPQFELPEIEDKHKNVEGAFSVAQPELLKGKMVLLVDDVLTSGSTANQCSKAIMDAGAKRVDVLTFLNASTHRM